MIRAPSVSAVVPTRDRPELLRRSLRAILDQRYDGRLEVVVVYDQSRPESLDDIEPGRGRSIRVISNEGTAGLAGARNAGVRAATGDLVGFCDDDDVWEPDKLRRQVEVLLRHPGAEVATTGIVVHYRDREVPRVTRREVITFRDLLRSRMSELHPSTFLVRRSAFEEGIGPVDEQLPGSYAEDYEFLLRAARRSPVVAVREPLVHVYWHPSSFFARRWRMIAEALMYLLDAYPEFRTDPGGRARIAGQIAFAYAGAGERRLARRWVATTLRADWREPRAYLALACALGVVSNETVLRMLHTTGRGF